MRSANILSETNSTFIHYVNIVEFTLFKKYARDIKMHSAILECDLSDSRFFSFSRNASIILGHRESENWSIIIDNIVDSSRKYDAIYFFIIFSPNDFYTLFEVVELISACFATWNLANKPFHIIISSEYVI